MPLQKFSYLILIITLAIVSSCTKLETFPTTPKITFKTLQYADTLISSIDNQSYDIKTALRLSFDVKDGDGDLGENNDGTGNLPVDLFLTVYGKSKGVWIKDTVKNTYTMPYLTPEGQNKSVYATVNVESLYWVNNRNQRQIPYDTIKCVFYIMDRAMNKSNIDSSGITVISRKLKY